MKAKVIKTGEIVEVYHEPQHGQITNIYKEAVLVNGRMWDEAELDFNCITKANEAPESYPVQFKDKIDEYLWKEHHILGGCCSSVESMRYAVAREVAEKLTDALIEKALDYIENNIYDHYDGDNEYGICGGYVKKEEFIKNFKDYMKG